HAAGDAVLQEFARLATSGLRATDTLGRWGGEEFLLVVAGGRDGATCVLDRIRQSVRHACLEARPVTFSAGLAEHRPGEGLDAVLARADAALYRAKAAGRDRTASAPEPGR
ncbi:GGDEF domain-containing protein, partial [Lysobacter xanthus]